MKNPSYKIFELPIPIPGHEAVSYLYLVQSTRIALIDTGPASTLPILFSRLADLKINPADIDYVLATHIHLDHLGGLNQALDQMTRAKVIVHPRGIPHLLNPEKLWQASLAMSGQIALDYGQPTPVRPQKLIAAEDCQVIDLGAIKLEVIFTPGHAPHHLSFIDRNNGNLFAGEAAGIYFSDTGVVRPAAPPPFDPLQSLASLDKMIDLHPHVVYYCHYGKAERGTDNLCDSRASLLLWTETVSRFFKPHLEPGEELLKVIMEAIISKDGSKAQFRTLPPQRLKTELYFLLNNVRGFWDYFKKESLKSECHNKTG